MAEGAGAATLACLLANPGRFAGRTVGLVLSGGNIDSRVLSIVIEHGLVRDGRMVRLRIEIPDVPGVLAKVAGIVGACGANIVEVHHQRTFSRLPVKHTDLDVVLETLDRNHVAEIIDRLGSAGYRTHDADALSAGIHPPPSESAG